MNYTGLRAWDAEGRDLPVHFVEVEKDGALAATGGIAVEVDVRDARYPVMIDPIAQQAYLKASNTQSSDFFGFSVAISGDTAVIGAPGEDGDGLNENPPSTNGVNGDPSDNSVSNAGAAYVFVRSGGGWIQQAYLKGVIPPFLLPTSGDGFGNSVAISGDTIVVGASAKSSFRGAAFVFTRSGTTWDAAPVRLLTAASPENNDFFGDSVAISGNTIVVGAYDDGGSPGTASVFVRNGTLWDRQATLAASNPGAGDSFGGSVDISGDTIVVGASGEDSSETGTGGNGGNNNALSAGAAYVFVRNGQNWPQQAYLKASNAEAGDFFGSDVAVSGETVLVGAIAESSGAAGINGTQSNNSVNDSGAVYVFMRNGGTWNQQAYVKASNPGEFDQFGKSVAISGDTAIIGASGESSAATGINGAQGDNTANSSGAAYVFTRQGATWTQLSYLKASNTDVNDQFGGEVGISGLTLIVGAAAESGNGASQSDNTALNAGASYVFTLPLPPAAPSLRVLGTRVRRTTATGVLLRGIASDENFNLSRVEVKVGNTKWKKARGTVKWSFTARNLRPGRNMVSVRAVDTTRLFSRTAKVILLRR